MTTIKKMILLAMEIVLMHNKFLKLALVQVLTHISFYFRLMLTLYRCAYSHFFRGLG